MSQKHILPISNTYNSTCSHIGLAFSVEHMLDIRVHPLNMWGLAEAKFYVARRHFIRFDLKTFQDVQNQLQHSE